MIGDGSIFCDLDNSIKSQVRLGSEALVEAKRKDTRFIQNVLYSTWARLLKMVTPSTLKVTYALSMKKIIKVW